MFVQRKEVATVQTAVPRENTVHVDDHKQITPNHKIFNADTYKYVALGGNVVDVDNNNTGTTISNPRSNNKSKYKQVSNLYLCSLNLNIFCT